MFRDGAERLLVFQVGAERFAVALAAVDEAIDAPPLRPLPDAGRTVLGIATIRGALVPIYDPRPLLNVEGRVDDAALLFVRGDARAGLAVSGVHDAILVNETELRPAPGTDASDRVMIGVVRRGAELIAILDAGALLDAAMSATGAQGERT